MLINLQEIKDFVSISAVADYLGLEEEYGKRKFPGERTASIEYIQILRHFTTLVVLLVEISLIYFLT